MRILVVDYYIDDEGFPDWDFDRALGLSGNEKNWLEAEFDANMDEHLAKGDGAYWFEISEFRNEYDEYGTLEGANCHITLLGFEPVNSPPPDSQIDEQAIEQVWRDTKGIIPSTGEMWLTPRMLREAESAQKAWNEQDSEDGYIIDYASFMNPDQPQEGEIIAFIEAQGSQQGECEACDGEGRIPNHSQCGDQAGGWADTCHDCNGTGREGSDEQINA